MNIMRHALTLKVRKYMDLNCCDWYEAIQTGSKAKCDSKIETAWCKGCPHNEGKPEVEQRGFADTLSPGGATARSSKRAW
jgi:hypothetical protein